MSIIVKLLHTRIDRIWGSFRALSYGVLFVLACLPLHISQTQAQTGANNINSVIRLPIPRPSPEDLKSGNLEDQGTENSAPSNLQPEVRLGGTSDEELPDADFLLTLQARLDDKGSELTKGVTWRIFEATSDFQQEPKLIVEVQEGILRQTLPAGTYIAQASFGLANIVKLIDLRYGPLDDVLTFDAGGVLLRASVGDDRMLEAEEVTFSIFVSDPNTGVRTLLARGIEPEKIIRLAADTYHVVSQFGGANAIRRADIRVQPGKLTEVTIIQRAAEITLKLVAESGGEALANTQWTVLTPGGDVVSELIGAFPNIVLAEGEYTAIARQNNETFMREFSVETALDREIEVLATN